MVVFLVLLFSKENVSLGIRGMQYFIVRIYLGTIILKMRTSKKLRQIWLELQMTNQYLTKSFQGPSHRKVVIQVVRCRCQMTTAKNKSWKRLRLLWMATTSQASSPLLQQDPSGWALTSRSPKRKSCLSTKLFKSLFPPSLNVSCFTEEIKIKLSQLPVFD